MTFGAACSGGCAQRMTAGRARWALLSDQCQCRTPHRGSRLGGLRPPTFKSLFRQGLAGNNPALRPIRSPPFFGASDAPDRPGRRISWRQEATSPDPNDKTGALTMADCGRVRDFTHLGLASPRARKPEFAGAKIPVTRPERNPGAATRISPSSRSTSGAAGTIHPSPR